MFHCVKLYRNKKFCQEKINLIKKNFVKIFTKILLKSLNKKNRFALGKIA